MNAALKGRSSTVVQKACSSTGFNDDACFHGFEKACWLRRLAARMGQWAGPKGPYLNGAMNAALKGRSSTVVQKACSCTGFNVAFRT